jgi:WD40 repeat protein
MDILAGLAFSYLFERNQRLLQLIYRRQPAQIHQLGNFTLNPKYRLNLLGRSSLSVLLATRLVQSDRRNYGFELQLAKRIMSCTHKLPEISPPKYTDTLSRHNDHVYSIVFHPTFPFFATSSEDMSAILWRLSADGLKATYVQDFRVHLGGVYSVAIHPSLNLLATGGQDNKINLWNLKYDGSKATHVANLNQRNGGHSESVKSVVFHSTLPLLASSCNKTVKLWNLVYTPDGLTVTCIANLAVPSIGICSFHPNLHLFANCSVNNTVNLWSLIQTSDSWTATQIITLVGHSSLVRSIAFHPTAPLLATGSNDNTVKLWQLSSNNSSATCVATLEGHSDSVRSVAFHPTAPFLATGSNDKTVKLWYFGNTLDRSDIGATCVATLGSTKTRPWEPGQHKSYITVVAFHPTAPLLLTGSGGVEDNTVKLWKL